MRRLGVTPAPSPRSRPQRVVMHPWLGPIDAQWTRSAEPGAGRPGLVSRRRPLRGGGLVVHVSSGEGAAPGRGGPVCGCATPRTSSGAALWGGLVSRRQRSAFGLEAPDLDDLPGPRRSNTLASRPPARGSGGAPGSGLTRRGPTSIPSSGATQTTATGPASVSRSAPSGPSPVFQALGPQGAPGGEGAPVGRP